MFRPLSDHCDFEVKKMLARYFERSLCLKVFYQALPAGRSEFCPFNCFYLLTEVPLPQTDQSCAQVNGIEHAMYIWRKEETLVSIKSRIVGTKILLGDPFPQRWLLLVRWSVLEGCQTQGYKYIKGVRASSVNYTWNASKIRKGS